MTYQPIPTVTTGVGERRVWSIDTETKEHLARIADALERIQEQLSLITGVSLEPGDQL